MGSLIAGALGAFGQPAGLAGDAPNVPSAPVEIGTNGVRRGVSEAGSWQVLLVMFALVLVLGTVVLMYAVRQRTRVLRRRRVRRMGEVAAMMAALGDGAPTGTSPGTPDTDSAAVSVPIRAASPTPARATPRRSPRTTPRSAPKTPNRPSPNA